MRRAVIAVNPYSLLTDIYFRAMGFRMAYTVPPPERPIYGPKIKEMPRRSDIFFKGADNTSIKAIASRLGAALGRKYLTRKEDGGVRVWRVA